MDTIEDAMTEQGVLSQQERVYSRIREARTELAALKRRLERLARLQLLLKEKYRSRIADLYAELSTIDKQQRELTGLARQLRMHRERRANTKKQVAGLERRKKIIGQAIKQVTGYEKSSNTHVEAMEDEQEILAHRINDLEHVLELAEQADLSGSELDIVARRVDTTQALLREYEMGLSKRTIDLLFEFYIPPSPARRLKL